MVEKFESKRVPPSEHIILSISDLQSAAAAKLPTGIRDFYNSGSTDQITVLDNSNAYKKYKLRPRVLRDVSNVSTSASVLGKTIDFPLCVSPAGIQAMAHPLGELATSRACAKRNVHMGISSFSNYSVEEICEASRAIAPIGHVMQVYSMKDRAKQERIIKRAEQVGCVAIFLTADSPVLGVRYNEHRNDFRTPAGLAFPMLEKTSEMIRADTHDASFVGFNSDYHSWAREIPWLRSITKMQVWIKGVLTAEDVLLAREYGCDGVVVSNHGGRQLDGTPATIDALPECVEAAAGQIRVHIDGGIRSGQDIFKALALGAECCWVGRPAIWSLAYDGEAGVRTMLDILYTDFRRCMQLTGCSSIADISKSSLGIARKDGPLARL
ncbi:(S)-2-hydroxy-acid oxidase [Macroventuria anomochaeta]|uniref:(S)-2-hydroxy-acid oxidase n=1 Tax=Macroventuria anomochaeta TaxID=301207 RepID=A0ACB6RRH5_9PLEO|nr:(S)-2-hydroxy-acid oxidase [Macroventuria anomochaeta]KAF2624302.1 (S)-2-hydroxy-acid oxidase [Macroventuria anomochaeta]